jgi:hypothetical protein
VKPCERAGEFTSLAAGVEADSAFRRIGRRLQQRQQLAVDIAQRRVVLQQRPVNLRKVPDAAQAKFWKKELGELLQSAPRMAH